MNGLPLSSERQVVFRAFVDPESACRWLHSIVVNKPPDVQRTTIYVRTAHASLKALNVVFMQDLPVRLSGPHAQLKHTEPLSLYGFIIKACKHTYVVPASLWTLGSKPLAGANMRVGSPHKLLNYSHVLQPLPKFYDCPVVRFTDTDILYRTLSGISKDNDV